MEDEEIISVRPAQESTVPRVKPPPKSNKIPSPFLYEPSDDGTDENLLILLHGLGDTQIPFAKLGKQLKLPQTATLAIRAPEQIPYLDVPGFQWYPSFSLLGEPLTNPNPTSALNLLSSIVSHLTDDCNWPIERIHLFGFGQGGTLAVEFGLTCWKEALASSLSSETAVQQTHKPLASIISIAGPLLSYPTLSQLCPTPLLIFHRAPTPNVPAEDDQMNLPSAAFVALRKGYSHLQEIKVSAGGGMPRSQAEWEPIMRFWSEKLGRRMGEGMYEVLSGMGPPPVGRK